MLIEMEQNFKLSDQIGLLVQPSSKNISNIKEITMTYKINMTLMALCCILFPSIANADVEEQKQACTSQQSSDLDDAFKAAKKGLLKTIDSIKSPNANDESRLINWFGVGTPADIKSVLGVYETALTLSAISTYWCPKNSIPDLVWDVGDIAAVHPAAPGAMFFTPDFFAQSKTGTDSRQGTIIHELSHLSGATLKPETYKPGPAKNLALSNPANARKNGDNFQYYYENANFGTP
jgi:peptidyl-Lys metalloendopeptidase